MIACGPTGGGGTYGTAMTGSSSRSVWGWDGMAAGGTLPSSREGEEVMGLWLKRQVSRQPPA